MSTVQTLQTNTDNSAVTEALGEALGRNLRGGELIELVSDLGGGKTTLTRGIARGAGSSDIVASPTFLINRIYQAPNFEIHHYDLYRLAEAGLSGHELDDVLGDPGVVVVAEWAGVVDDVLPKERVVVSITRSNAAEGRKFTITAPESLAYLLEGIS